MDDLELLNIFLFSAAGVCSTPNQPSATLLTERDCLALVS